MARIAFLVVAAALGSAAGAQVFRDPSQPFDKRAADIEPKLTLEEKAAQMQHSAPAVPRLGIPAYTYWNERPHGVARAAAATGLPAALGLAPRLHQHLLV